MAAQDQSHRPDPDPDPDPEQEAEDPDMAAAHGLVCGCGSADTAPGSYGLCRACFLEHITTAQQQLQALGQYAGQADWVDCQICGRFYPALFLYVRLRGRIVCPGCMKVLVGWESRRVVQRRPRDGDGGGKPGGRDDGGEPVVKRAVS